MDVNLFCHDTGLMQCWSVCYFGLFLYLFHKLKHLLKKRVVEAAKSNCLSSRRVKIRFSHKGAASRKTELFCIHVGFFWRTKCKLTKTITEQCFSCQNKKESHPNSNILADNKEAKYSFHYT